MKSRSFHILIPLIVVLLASLAPAYAYRESTHQIMSKLALQRSDLNRSNPVYGLLGIPYYEAWSAISYGARHEDSGVRFLHHFYNPRNGIGLQGLGTSLVSRPSPEWILDPQGIRASQVTRTYSLYEASNFYYAALTEPFPQIRKQLALGMFGNLGNVVHHIQDMAQPQHTRLDEHCDGDVCKELPDKNTSKDPGVPRYDPSAYELHTAMRQGTLQALPALDPVYSKANPNPAFTTPMDFWKNKNKPGEGMAEFSNYHFMTKRSIFLTCTTNTRGYCNLADPDLPTPNLTNTSESMLTMPGRPGARKYVVNELGVPMGLTPLIKADGIELSQNSFVYDKYVEALIPKAISYSAGLINFHFRGDVNAALNASGNVLLTNSSPDTATGDYELFYDASDGFRRPSGFKWTGAIPKGQTIDTGIPVPQVNGSPPNQFILAFKGTIGEATNQVAGRSVTLQPPTPPKPPTPMPEQPMPTNPTNPQGGAVNVTVIKTNCGVNNYSVGHGDTTHTVSDTFCGLNTSVEITCSGGCYAVTPGTQSSLNARFTVDEILETITPYECGNATPYTQDARNTKLAYQPGDVNFKYFAGGGSVISRSTSHPEMCKQDGIKTFTYSVKLRNLADQSVRVLTGSSGIITP